MSVQVPRVRSSLPRGMRDVAENARRAAQSAVSKASLPSQEERRQNAQLRESRKAPRHEHGSRIYVFHHLQKNHIVYSLDKVMKNNAALRQLPFNGKKTVPSALRKDLWSPFAMVQFPPGHAEVGLSAFQRLREYRRRHELEWGDEIRYREQTPREIADKKPKQLEQFHLRGRKICDQKANSVADIAAVLGNLDAPRTEPRTTRGRASVPTTPEVEQLDGAEAKESETKATVYWRSLDDAEFASDWSQQIEHGGMWMLGKDGELKPEHLYESEEGLDVEGGAPVDGESAPSTKPKSIWKLFSKS